MLQQVSITQLTVFFIQRSGINPHTDRHLIGRHPIMAHTIAHAIVQLAKCPFGIARNIAVLIDPGRFPLGL